MIKAFLFIFLLSGNVSRASQHHVIDTIGASPKGQFVALEEYGYLAYNHSYFVRIRIVNVWKKEYVGKPFEVILPAHRPSFLQKARKNARLLAKDELKKFEISF